MSVLIATVGLPRSGKSTFSRVYADMHGVPIVCPDSIRLALHGQRFVPEAEPYVWSIAHTMVGALFLSGHPVVILDSCNRSDKRRREWIAEQYETLFVHMCVDGDTCKKRAGDDHVLKGVIDRMILAKDEDTHKYVVYALEVLWATFDLVHLVKTYIDTNVDVENAPKREHKHAE